MLAELQEVFLLELLYIIRALHLIGKTARLYCKTVGDLPVTEDSQSCAIFLVLFISKLAIVVLEVWGEVVENHGEALYDDVVIGFLVNRGVAKD